MTFKDFTKSLGSEGVEGEIIRTVLISIITSFLIFGIIYFFKFQYIENFLSEKGFYLILAFLSYSIIIPTIRQVRAYKEFACMSGMMVGMTVGMISGFLSGFYVGATNGMFWGSFFGMAVGISFGVWSGKCCGVMGFLEGIMSGFMGGLMGAMTAVMMFNDNLKAASVLVFIISAIILFSLEFMIYKEMKEIERKHKDDDFFVVFWTLVLTLVTIWLSVFGPRSVFLQ